MDSATGPIESLLERLGLQFSELQKLRELIKKSSRFTVVIFIDLADSTSMKQSQAADEWLLSIYGFIKRCDYLADKAKGTVVKRIGDEVMLTFPGVLESELFIDSLAKDSGLKGWKFKVSADAGHAYHFQFLPALPDDPYGPVIDRCARIAKLALSGSVVCSQDYFYLLASQRGSYVRAGEVQLRGLKNMTEVYVRRIDAAGLITPSLYSEPQAKMPRY